MLYVLLAFLQHRFVLDIDVCDTSGNCLNRTGSIMF